MYVLVVVKWSFDFCFKIERFKFQFKGLLFFMVKKGKVKKNGLILVCYFVKQKLKSLENRNRPVFFIF